MPQSAGKFSLAELVRFSDNLLTFPKVCLKKRESVSHSVVSTRGVGIRDQTCKANRLSGLRQDTVNPSASFSFSQAQAVLQLINLAGCLEIYP